MRPAHLIAAALAATLALAGCGEKSQVVVYKQGKYQGKPDTKPWDSAEFGGDKLKWEAAIKARNQSQNEYRRVGG
jgi:outer membrane protein assembly factor BamE (lipoprotein component of BamABCDE complex)